MIGENIHQFFFALAANGELCAAGHFNRTAVGLYITVYLFKVDDEGVMNAEKVIMHQHFFNFFQGFRYHHF